MRESLHDFCIRKGCQELLNEWVVDANLPLTPTIISRGSKRKIWWRCEKGHNWRAAVYTRTGSGTGCPVCAGKVAQAGESDLATPFPELARQLHSARNGNLTPEQVVPGSHRMVWWICEKGHEWRAQVKSRAAGCGCPVCANREIRPAENDLAARYPQPAGQWHPTKNGGLTPEQIPPGTSRKVWWRCEKGHEWQAAVSSRTCGSGCPVCAGKKVLAGENDLASQFPDIAAQWHPTRNGSLTPRMVTAGSHKRVWWICAEGHVWKAAIYARAGKQKSGCPICAGAVGRKRHAPYETILAEAKEVTRV